MSLHLDHKTLGAGAAQPTPLHVEPGGGLPQPIPPGRPPSRLGAIARTGLQTSAVFSLIVFGVGFVVERAAPYPWKPSTMLGAYGGNQEAAHVLTAIDAERAKIAVQQGEAARAQEEVISVQAANERATRAYDALFQRGTAQAQAWAHAATQALVMDFQTRAAVLAQGKGDVSSMKDTLSALCDVGKLFLQTPDCGDALRGSAKGDRDAMSDELIANFKRQSAAIAAALRDWSQGLPDPAALMAAQAQAVNQAMQAAPRLPVPPSPVYRSVPAAALVPEPAPTPVRRKPTIAEELEHADGLSIFMPPEN